MRRILAATITVLVLALAPQAPAAQPASTTSASWASTQIQEVVAGGLMAPSSAEFRPDDPLTAGELADLLTGLGDTPTPPVDPGSPVTLGALDAALVRHLGLAPTARQFRSVLLAGGLEPSKLAGSEVVARLLGLRLNHPQESLELELTDPVTRSEAAYSVARVLELAHGSTDGYTVAMVKAKAATFTLPTLSDWQRRILTRAVSFIGYPYIWAGTSEKPQAPLGTKTPGGFDCSGFVWRVYKLEQYPGAPQLATVLKGRTTYVMSGEVKPALRVSYADLQPADVIFFGAAGPRSKPSQVGHMGIYIGNGWFIHSSGRGVTIWPLEGWYKDEFAWGRRPLAEAGLEPGAGGDSTAPAPTPVSTGPTTTGSSGSTGGTGSTGANPAESTLIIGS